MLTNPSFITLISNEKGVIKKCGGKISEIFQGQTNETVEGSNIVSLFGNDIIEPFRKALAGKTTYFKGELTLISDKKKDASVFLTSSENNCIMIVQDSIESLSSKSLSELAGGIAHSFNNGLNTINANMELLTMEMPDCPKVKRCSKEVFDSITKMTVLTDKILAYAQEGKFHQERIEIDQYLPSLINDLNIPPEISLKSVLESEGLSIVYEPKQLKLLLSSLIDNAVESISKYGDIIISTTQESIYKKDIGNNNYICLSVKDNGCGMENDVKRNMFNPFYSTKRKGRGLELAAVEGIVNNHKGWIDVKSNKNIGTAINVYIPVCQKDSNFIKEKEKSIGNGTILIVEDELAILEMTAQILERKGYKVLKSATGEDAVNILENDDEIDLVLLDINLPGISGFEVLEKVYYKKSLKFIICSGYHEKNIIHDYAGEDISFIAKPYSFNTLLNEIRNFLDRRIHKRYELTEDTFVHMEDETENKRKIVDISLSGIAFHYKNKIFNTNGHLNISLSNKKSQPIDSIPFILLYEEDCVLRGKFGELSKSQKYYLNSFITQNSYLP
ncbi:MAG: response regulator [Deltaproteobacteria bacterium]|nr:response regulator [Deltaproteobacteria bacterium]